jgi:hypothetical protein
MAYFRLSSPGHSLTANAKMISRDLGCARRSNDKKHHCVLELPSGGSEAVALIGYASDVEN